MPKLKNYEPGERVNIYLPSRHRKIAKEIDNLSQFVQIALEQAASIMAFDIVKRANGLNQKPPTADQVQEWNQNHPLNPLTAKRTGKTNSGPASPTIRQNETLDT